MEHKVQQSNDEGHCLTFAPRENVKNRIIGY